MLSIFSVLVWAVEITKETRAASGNILSKRAFPSDVPETKHSSRSFVLPSQITAS